MSFWEYINLISPYRTITWIPRGFLGSPPLRFLGSALSLAVFAIGAQATPFYLEQIEAEITFISFKRYFQNSIFQTTSRNIYSTE